MRTEGEKNRDEALDLFKANNSTTVEEIREAMTTLYRRRQWLWDRDVEPYVSGDDAALWLDERHYGGDYRIIGAVFRSGWRRVGTIKSKLARRNARPIATWAELL